MKIRRKGQ